jgi:hypothetical protein
MTKKKQSDDSTFVVYKIKRKRVEAQSIIILSFCLAFIILFSLNIRKNRNALNAPSFNLPIHELYGVADSIYFNKPLHFILRSPGPTWEFTVLAQGDPSFITDTTTILWDQIQWLVNLYPIHDSVNVKVQMGILIMPSRVDDKNLTISLLAEVLKKYPNAAQDVKILTPVTQPAHHVLQGAFCTIVLPQEPKSVVRIISLLPRKNTAYVFDCSVAESEYSVYRISLSRIISRFVPL